MSRPGRHSRPVPWWLVALNVFLAVVGILVWIWALVPLLFVPPA